MTKTKNKFDLSIFIFISITYIAAYSMTSGFFSPLEKILAPNLPSNISLMFIPHGVRVISFYFYGRWAYIYLAPASWLMWALEVYGDKNINFLPAGILISLIACHLGVTLSTTMLRAYKHSNSSPFNWKELLIAGTFGSIINSVGLTAIYDGRYSVLSFFGYLLGDISGQFFLMLIGIMFFRLVRSLNKLP